MPTLKYRDPADGVFKPVPGGSSGGGEGGTTVHNELTGREDVDAHPMAAVTGLVSALAAKPTVTVSASAPLTPNVGDIWVIP